VIAILSEEAVSKGWRMLSFDLPEHGERRDEGIPCKGQTCVQEPEAVTEYAKEIAGEIATPIGQTLYWDYYCYVKAHPIDVWNAPTSILYGSEDNLCEYDRVSDFAGQFHAGLRGMERGEHFFHTGEQLEYCRQWLREEIE